MHPSRFKRVGLTGGIASGKSTVAALFAELGVPVIDLDVIAREVVAPGTALLDQVIARFGPGVRSADGGLNRRALRDLIFHHVAARRDLESLLHPAIWAIAAERATSVGGPYQIIVAPLLIETRLTESELVETGSAHRYDRILVVDCDATLQRDRLACRDEATAEQIEAALKAQASRAARLAFANDVIHNDGDPEALRPQVLKLHQHYLSWAAAGQPRLTRP